MALTIVLVPVVAGIAGILPNCVAVLGEEIGWQGLLVTELAKVTTFAKTSFISGVIWAIWHCPLILFSDYRYTTPRWHAVICFTILVVGISFAFAWLRLKSGSRRTAKDRQDSRPPALDFFESPVRGPLTPRDRVALCGPNAAGKSTLVRHIVDNHRLPSQRVTYLPQEVSASESRRIIEETWALPMAQTAAENVAATARALFGAQGYPAPRRLLGIAGEGLPPGFLADELTVAVQPSRIDEVKVLAVALEVDHSLEREHALG